MKNIGIANFTLFKRPPVQKDTLFKTLVKLYTQFKTQDLENHTFSSGTYPYRPNKGVPPRENKVSQWTLFDEIASQDVTFSNKVFQVYNKYGIRFMHSKTQ